LLRAALWMLMALCCFSAMAVGGRQLAGAMSTFELLFIRSIIGCLVITALLCHFGWAQARPRQLGFHLLRNASHFGGQYAWFYAVGVLPLAEVFAIEFTTPIWTAVIAALFLHERITAARILAVVMGFVGILIILRPGLEIVRPAAVAMLAGALGFAVSVTSTKHLTRAQSTLAVLFYMTLMQMAMGLIPALQDWIWPTGAMVPWLVAVGLAALGAHFGLTRALSLADTTLVAPFDFLRLPLIALIGLLLYDEVLDPSVFVGAALVFGGNYVNVRGALTTPKRPVQAQGR
jgi:drug/metabolite transporter (DMT)-like permease